MAQTFQEAEAQFNAGQFQEAASLYLRSVTEGDEADTAHYRLACLAYRENKLEQSVEHLGAAIALRPDHSEYHYNLGSIFRMLGQLESAETSYRRALELDPANSRAWIALGILLRSVDDVSGSEACYLTALELDQGSFEAHINLANVLLLQDRHEDAAAHYRRAVELNPATPASAEANYRLGSISLNQKDYKNAAIHLRKVLEIDPKHAEALVDLGAALCELERFAEALPFLLKGRELSPRSQRAGAYCRIAYFNLGKYREAAIEAERALRIFPGDPEIKSMLATALMYQGQYTKPRKLYEEALAQRPDDDYLRTNVACFLLRSSDWTQGWDYYESRLATHPAAGHSTRNFGAPRWRGECLAGRTLLITSEQGLGDEIMFGSLYRELISASGHIMIECDQRLESLFRRSFPTATLVPVPRNVDEWWRVLPTRLDTLPAFDYWIPCGSLGAHLRSSAESFPSTRSYLVADSEKTRRWAERLAGLGEGLKVGISWRGGTQKTNTVKRTLSLEPLTPIFSLPGLHAINLQYGDCEAELAQYRQQSGLTIQHWPEAIADYDETAALVGALDLVISVCTSLVHLTGALGQPVWVMAPYVAEWRYGREGQSMPWYPSARIFRQPKADAWTPVIAEIGRELRKLRARK